MNNYTITGSFILPSLGKVYQTEIDPSVTLRTMTTAEEMRRMQSSDYPYKVMSDIIRECIISGPDINPYDMCIGDYLFLMHKLRIVTYGPQYTINTVCPYCTSNNIDNINLNDLDVKQYDPSILEYQEFELPQTHKKIKIRFQTPRMLDMIGDKIRHHKKKTLNKDINPELLYTISSIIETIDGDQPNILDIENWVQTLPMMDTQTILLYSDKLNNMIGIDKRLEATCDVCKLSYDTSFRINNEFFRPSLNI